MPDRTLSERPNLEQYKKQAKELRREAAAGSRDALERVHRHHPRFLQPGANPAQAFSRTDAQLVLAREHGFSTWAAFAAKIESLRAQQAVDRLGDPESAFLQYACVDREGSHGAGTLEQAEMIRSRYPHVSTASIYTASALGDASAVRAFLAANVQLATAKGGPHAWDALTYLCFSRYLRIHQSQTAAFVDTARALLDAGANANTGWTEFIDTPPRPVQESAIYGAAGIAHNAKLTRLLLEYGADPNDEETPYHAAEGYDNAVLQALLNSGRLNEKSLATIAARKCDWHDDKGLALVLDHGANPNYLTAWKFTPFHQSIRRDNGLEMIEALLDRGADPAIPNRSDGRNAFQMAAWHGRGDVLTEFERRGFTMTFDGPDALAALCARGDMEQARAYAERNASLLPEFQGTGGSLLAYFAGVGNDAGVRCLLTLGVPVDGVLPVGDGYWDLAPHSTALHVAAWRAQHEVVQTLIQAGAPVNACDARGRTALQLAVKACIDSYWKYRRKPDSVAALLAAGAQQDGIDLPTGYAEIDSLLSAAQSS